MPVSRAHSSLASGPDAAHAAAARIRARLGSPAPAAAIILGSGLGGLAEQIENAASIPFTEIPGFPSASVAGHAGTLIAGTLERHPVLALAGRFHMYEGHDAALAAFPTRVLHALGARVLIISNAAGGVRPTLRPGELLLLRDQVNLMFRNPLIGAIASDEVRFPDMSAPFDARLAALALDVARGANIALGEGVYCGLLGPSYETPAEVRMLARLGVDVVGMSTVPEVIVARALGMRVLGVSCVTNMACGLTTTPITHAEVIETTARAAAHFERLVRGVVARL
jgi:purine-nucleoside phosphorylase